MNDSDRDGQRYCCDRGGAQHRPFGEVHPENQALSHNRLNSSFEVGSGHARHADERRFHVELTNVKNAFCVNLGLTAEAQDLFVTSALPLPDHPLPNPPDQRVEPEDRFHDHLDGGGEVIPVSEVAKLMCDDGLQLRRRQPLEDAFRQQQDGTEDPENTRLKESRRGPC
jgi:hypothetical protein